MSTGTDDNASTDDLRSALAHALAELEKLRAENSRLTDVIRALQERASGKKPGGGGSSGGVQSEHERLRKKAEAQRVGKRRRAAARAAAKPTLRERGKRSVRPPFVADEVIEIDIPATARPVDARPNGFVSRGFYGVRIKRHNVLVKLREYISPTEGRLVAKLPEGWSGEYTPDTRVTIMSLNIGGMTEPKIRELFGDHDVKVSAGQINNVLLATADSLYEEKRAAHRAGMEHSPVVGIDGTHSTCDGDPMVCHIVGNEVFTSMTTTEHKDRVTVIGVLAGEPVGHRVGEDALEHPALGVAAREILRRVVDDEPVLAGADAELTALSTELRTSGLDATKMARFLSRAMPAAGAETLRAMLEATALQWLQAVLACLPIVMLADGGTNYHGILAVLQLCWIHALRPYSLMPEGTDSERVLREGWVLYRRLCDWRVAPDPSDIASIEAEFDRVFDPGRCDDRDVRHAVESTRGSKRALLALLQHPEVSADNNGSERDAKVRVRKRDISGGPRSLRGLRAWDTMQSVTATLRKLKISPVAFHADRISGRGRFARLDVLVRNACILRYGPRQATGTV